LDECPWSRLLTEQHDGVLFEVPKGRGRELADVYKRNVERPIDFTNCTLRRDFQLVIPCEESFGENWKDME